MNTAALEESRAMLSVIEARRTSVEEEASSVRDEIHTIELAIKDERRTHDDSLRSTHDVN